LADAFCPAFLIQGGTLLEDGGWAPLGLAGVSALARDGSLGVTLGLLGGLYLCQLAGKALREGWHGPRRSGDRAATSAPRSSAP